MHNFDMLYWTWIFRIGERLFLTLLMVILTIGLLSLLWNKRFSVKVEPGDQLPIGTVSIAVAMPVVIFMIFAGYTYISLSNKIEITIPSQTAPAQQDTFRGFDETAAPDIAGSVSKNLERYATILMEKIRGNLTSSQAQQSLSLALKAVCVTHYSGTDEIADLEKFAASHEMAEILNRLNTAIGRISPRDVLCQSIKDQVR